MTDSSDPAQDGIQYAPPPVDGKKPISKALIGGIVAGVLLIGIAAFVVPMGLAANAKQNQMQDAVDECSLTRGSYTLLDEGAALEFSGAGLLGGADPDKVFCVLHELGAPESIESKIGKTRSLDGTRSAVWEGFAAEWTYHPDDGLNLLVEHSD